MPRVDCRVRMRMRGGRVVLAVLCLLLSEPYAPPGRTGASAGTPWLHGRVGLVLVAKPAVLSRRVWAVRARCAALAPVSVGWAGRPGRQRVQVAVSTAPPSGSLIRCGQPWCSETAQGSRAHRGATGRAVSRCRQNGRAAILLDHWLKNHDLRATRTASPEAARVAWLVDVGQAEPPAEPRRCRGRRG